MKCIPFRPGDNGLNVYIIMHFHCKHDDVIKWKHFLRYWPFCAGNSPATGEFPAQWPVMRSFEVFFDMRLNERLSKQSWGWWFETSLRPLWRHSDESWRIAFPWLMSQHICNERCLTIQVTLYFVICVAIFYLCFPGSTNKMTLLSWSLIKLYFRMAVGHYYIQTIPKWTVLSEHLSQFASNKDECGIHVHVAIILSIQ